MITRNNYNNDKLLTTVKITLSIVIAIAFISVLAIFLGNGGFEGMRTQRVWADIERFLNEHTEDNYHIVSQNGDTSIISFGDDERLDFNCWEPSIFNMGSSKGTYCSFSFYLDDSTITHRLGGYYFSQNINSVRSLVANAPGVYTETATEDRYRIKFDSDAELKIFFLRLLEIDDFNNMWEIYKILVSMFGEIQDTQKTDSDSVLNIIDPNGIYVDVFKNGHNQSLFDYAYKRGWSL